MKQSFTLPQHAVLANVRDWRRRNKEFLAHAPKVPTAHVVVETDGRVIMQYTKPKPLPNGLPL